MSKQKTIGDETFEYENKGKYIEITDFKLKGDKPEEGTLQIHIPETIDGLPVMVVDQIYVHVNYRGNFEQNGYDGVTIHLPEDAVFSGLKQVRIDQYSVFTPRYSTKFYPRKNSSFKADYKSYHFSAEKINDTDCRIFLITGSESSSEKLVVPAELCGYRVIELCDNCTPALPDKIKKIYVEEGVESIGDKCFFGLPHVTDFYIPRSVRKIGEKVSGYSVTDEYEPDLPKLTVHYYDSMPETGKEAFDRYAWVEIYEDFRDWGMMYTGEDRLVKYKVVFKKNNP